MGLYPKSQNTRETKRNKKITKKKKQGEGGKIYKENCIIKSGETQILNSKEHSK